MSGLDEYNITPGSNTSLAGMAVSDSTDPSVVDNIIRQLMADTRRFANDIGAKAVSSGTDSVTLTTETVLTAYADGTMLGFIAGGTNTGATTLNVDGVGAKAIRKGADTALAAGDITAGMLCIVAYDASANSAAGAWMLGNPLIGASQPLDADLTAIAALANTDGNVIVGNGSAWVAESGATARTSLGAAGTSQTGEPFYGLILGALSDRDYRIVLKAAHGGTITETVTRSVSGTATATFKINTTGLGGTANSVSSSEDAQAHASANVFVADDDIVITISSNAACADMSFAIKYTRTLA